MAVVMLLLALICFVLASLSVPMGRFNIGWLGLAFMSAAMLVGPVSTFLPR